MLTLLKIAVVVACLSVMAWAFIGLVRAGEEGEESKWQN